MFRRAFLKSTMVIGLISIGCSATPWRGMKKIGLVQSFHGPNAESAMATHVMIRDLIIEHNLRGGVNGFRLELASLDDEANPATLTQRIAELETDPMIEIILVKTDIPGVALPAATAPVRMVAGSDSARRILLEFLRDVR